MFPATVLVYYQMAQFLMLLMVVSWTYSTFFFLPLCMVAGPTGDFGQLTCKNVKDAQKSIWNFWLCRKDQSLETKSVSNDISTVYIAQKMKFSI